MIRTIRVTAPRRPSGKPETLILHMTNDLTAYEVAFELTRRGWDVEVDAAPVKTYSSATDAIDEAKRFFD